MMFSEQTGTMALSQTAASSMKPQPQHFNLPTGSASGTAGEGCTASQPLTWAGSGSLGMI